MIEIQNLTKFYRTNTGREYIFRNLSFTIPADKNVALIGKNGAGKSTLMRLLSGLDMPDSGRILSAQSISWPVGLSGGFQNSLTGRQNAKFVCRVHGAEGDAMRQKVAFIEDFAEIGRYFDRPVKTYSSGMRARVAFGLSLAFDFDYYLVDEAMSVGDAPFKKKATAAFRNRVDGAKIILVTHGMKQVKDLCDYVLLVNHGQIFSYEDVQEGIAAYMKL